MSFESGYEDLYEGFAFVQYVCVYAGIPVVWPEDVLVMIQEPVEDAAQLQPGDLIALYYNEGEEQQMLMAIASGDSRVVYATQDGAYVLESALSDMKYDALYRWSSEAAY